MSLSTILLILTNQFKQKWGRFLLASGGILIGVWAITLTTSLSLGLQNTIIEAINSQPDAKRFSLSKINTGATSFFEIREAPKFVAIGEGEIKDLQARLPDIKIYAPDNALLNLYVINQQKLAEKSDFSCLQNVTTLVQPNQSSITNPDCQNITQTSFNFEIFYDSNRTNWVGDQNSINNDEVVTCFRCGFDFYKQFEGVNEPRDLIGKQVTFELNSAPVVYKQGEIVDVTNSTQGSKPITESRKFVRTIKAVVDDRNNPTFGLPQFFLPKSDFNQAIELSDQNIPVDQIGYTGWVIQTESYEQVPALVEELQKLKYLPFSIVLTTIQAVQILFQVLTWVLAGFGFIALIASVFGIINVMTISILERRKEIGVYKAMGARDRDIFTIFLTESALLGLLGWLLGTLLALASGWLISVIFKALVDNNPDWRNNLQSLNIENFNPAFPWWLLLLTLILALFFTLLSGIIPAIRAARQNPVEVLRSE